MKSEVETTRIGVETPIRLRILVVDNSAVMRKVISHSARIAGLTQSEFIEAEDGASALQALRSRGADLVLLDLHMPRMSGEAFLEVIHRDPDLRNTPVVVVSSDAQPERIRRAHEFGARFIRKPFRPEELRGLLESIDEVNHALGTRPETD